MKYAIIESGAVANLAVAEEPLANNWVESDTAAIGDLYLDGQFSKPPVNTEALAQAARTQRNALLAASDWTQLADSTADKAAWATYRQALRDITAQDGFPTAITWPEMP